MTNKELGGYIELEYSRGKEYHINAVALNCGRNCLAYLIKAYSIKKIFLPYFLCDSVHSLCKKLGVQVEFYNIEEDFSPIFPQNYKSEDWFYFVNYYGQFDKQKILQIKKKVQNLIIDNSQAFFDKPVCNIPTLYTSRKFFGVTDGAYLYTEKKLNRNFEIDISYNRMNFLLGRFEKTASEFYAEYSSNNDLFENESIKQMSKLTRNLLQNIDYKFVKKQRTKNFAFLNKILNSYNKLNIKNISGAFAYPLLLEDGFDIRKKLQEQKIYIPTLWPNVIEECDAKIIEYKYAKNILPLPVDQRYNIDDMKYMIDRILECIN